MKPTKLVIFDFDGVLVDLCQVHRDTFAGAVLAVTGQSISDPFALEGLPTKVKLERLNITGQAAKDVALLKQMATMAAVRRLQPNRAKREMLERLHEQDISVALYSNAVRMTVETALEQMDLNGYFQKVLTNTDVTKPKPHSEGYVRIMESLGFTPDETLIVEDSAVGLTAAFDSGARVWAVKGPNQVTWKNLERELCK
jgi:beta-phosphoglucomutase